MTQFLFNQSFAKDFFATDACYHFRTFPDLVVFIILALSLLYLLLSENSCVSIAQSKQGVLDESKKVQAG